MNRRNSDAGYALIEAMVALALFAAMTGMLFQVIESTANARQHLTDARQAALIAQSRLAELQAAPAGDVSEGRNGRYRWQASIEPYRVEARGNSRGLERITVTVTSAVSGRKVATVSSLRLAR